MSSQTIHAFTNKFYPGHIEQTLEYATNSASDDARIVARAILTGMAYIAQSIDDNRSHEGLGIIADAITQAGGEWHNPQDPDNAVDRICSSIEKLASAIYNHQ